MSENLEIKKTGEIQLAAESILDKPLKQWTNKDKKFLTCRWVSVESLKKWINYHDTHMKPCYCHYCKLLNELQGLLKEGEVKLNDGC